MKATNTPTTYKQYNNAPKNKTEPEKSLIKKTDQTKGSRGSKDMHYDFIQNFTKEELEQEPLPKCYWAHLSCVSFLTNMSFVDEKTKTIITGYEKTDVQRFKLVCSVCRQKNVGCCMQCAQRKCAAAFHVECARLAEFYIETSGEDNTPQIFCEKHRPSKLQAALQENENDSIAEILHCCSALEKKRKDAEFLEEIKQAEKVRDQLLYKFKEEDKELLLSRIRKICFGYSSLTLTLTKNIDEANPGYALESGVGTLKYRDTLNRLTFPWRDVTFGRFSLRDCYNKYLEMIPNKKAYEEKILTEKKSEEGTKAELPRAEEPREEKDERYCKCWKTEKETPGMKMIRIMHIFIYRVLWRHLMSRK